MEAIKQLLGKVEPIVYAALRIIAGAMFACHALPKLFGVFGDPVPVGSQFWVGGIIELVTGLAIALGLGTRIAAFLASGQMAVAYFQFHVDFDPKQILPITNGGDDTVLYCFVFLFVCMRGPGAASFDRAIGLER
jgi:putative oxidoreductase